MHVDSRTGLGYRRVGRQLDANEFRTSLRQVVQQRSPPIHRQVSKASAPLESEPPLRAGYALQIRLLLRIGCLYCTSRSRSILGKQLPRTLGFSAGRDKARGSGRELTVQLE
jgi:hypothetical protein